jgi:glycosyltransferase involved in cell wall biosynthesis
VLFVDQSGRLGGAELYLLDLARAYRQTGRVVLFEEGPFADALRTEGVAVTILSPSDSIRQVRKTDHLWAALRAVPGLICTVVRLARLARNYDVVFANTQKALLVAGLAGLIARRPVLWNLHDLLTPDHFSALNRTVAVGCANWFATHVIANSEASRRAFADAGGKVPTSVVYNGIDPTPFTEGFSESTHALRKRLGVGEAPLVGVFSRLARWKGQHVLVEALAALPRVHALLVGDALFDGDEEYLDSLRHRISDLGLTDRVHFMGFRSDVPALMTACDIVVHTSISPEPFGRVIVEGMLAERPVVATSAGGAVEIVEHQRTGHLVPPNDPTTLTKTLTSLLDQPLESERMAQRGRVRAQEVFSIPKMIEGVQEAIDGAVAGRSWNGT